MQLSSRSADERLASHVRAGIEIVEVDPIGKFGRGSTLTSVLDVSMGISGLAQSRRETCAGLRALRLRFERSIRSAPIAAVISCGCRVRKIDGAILAEPLRRVPLATSVKTMERRWLPQAPSA